MGKRHRRQQKLLQKQQKRKQPERILCEKPGYVVRLLTSQSTGTHPPYAGTYKRARLAFEDQPAPRLVSKAQAQADWNAIATDSQELWEEWYDETTRKLQGQIALHFLGNALEVDFELVRQFLRATLVESRKTMPNI